MITLVGVFWKWWRHSRKTRESRKSTFWMVFKQFLKGKWWQIWSHFKYEWTIKNSNNKKLSGIKLNNRLGFDTHITNICNRVSQKLHALARFSQFMNVHKWRMTMNAFIASEFGYCPLVWMFHSRILNSRVNKLQERTLKIVYQDYASPFSELLE